MARTSDRRIEHLLRRAGFGARPDELECYGEMSVAQAVDAARELRAHRRRCRHASSASPDTSTRPSAASSCPQSNIVDARQRWLFRMVHSDRPLQEKMTLFWHNHFATGYAKIAGTLGAAEGDALHGGEVVGGSGQGARPDRDAPRECARQLPRHPGQHREGHGDARLARRPHEHEGEAAGELRARDHGAVHDGRRALHRGRRVCRRARVHRLEPGAARRRGRRLAALRVRLQRRAARHGGEDLQLSDLRRRQQDDPGARRPPTGCRTASISSTRSPASPNTARYLAAKLYRFFVSEFGAVNVTFVDRIASVYLQSRYDMKAVMREVLLSPEFWDQSAYFARYSWPVEFVVRALKDIGWIGFSVNDALTPLSNMGQILYEPPDVAGWDAGQAWFSTGAMLARMNFASTLAANQRFNLATAVKARERREDAGGAAVAFRRRARHGAARRRRDGGVVDVSARDRRLDRQRRAAPGQGVRPRSPDRRIPGVPTRMKVTRRQFVKGGVAAFTVTFAAPEFLSDLARAQGARVRNLVVLYLSGGNDALSMLIPYNDPFYTSRRPTLAVPAGQVLQIGTDSSRVALGLHPRLTGLKQIFDQGRLALIQRTGYENQSRSHFLGHRHLVHGRPEQLAGARLGRPLSRLAAVAGRSAGRLEHDRRACRACCRRARAVPAIANAAGYSFSSPNTGAEAARRARDRAAHHVARAGRSAGAGVRLRQLARRDGHARPRRVGRDLPAVAGLSQHRLRAGAAGRRRRDGRSRSARACST